MGHRAPGASLLLAAAALTLVNAGWGKEGHRVIGRVAGLRVGETTRQALTPLLGNATLADVSTWADEIKSDRSWDWARSLHYVNMPPNETAYVAARDCPDGDCIVAAIDRFAGVLRDESAPTEDRIVALKFLVHFVGDLHQPLHACYKADRGGNRIKLHFIGRSTNLHKMWDSDMIQRRLGGADWSAYADHLNDAIDLEIATALAADLDAGSWATESFGVARANCYGLPRDLQVKADYYDRNIGVVEQQLGKGGVRLAALLDDIFASSAAAPTAPPDAAPPVSPTEPPPSVPVTPAADDPASFLAIVQGPACGPDGGHVTLLHNTHATKTLRVTIRKRWADGEAQKRNEKVYTVLPGEKRMRKLGCSHAALRGGAVREFTWEIVAARWR